mgnify:CR=1 FL=1
MFCKKCSYQNTDGSVFCAKCGSKLTGSGPIFNDSSDILMEIYRAHSWSACARDVVYEIGGVAGRIKSGTRAELRVPRARLVLRLCMHPFLGLGEDIVTNIVVDPPSMSKRIRVDFSIQSDSALLPTTMGLHVTSIEYFE